MNAQCTHSQLVRPTFHSVVRGVATCPHCGKPLTLRPDLAAAVRLLAVVGGITLSLVSATRGTWRAAAATLLGAGILYVLSSLVVVLLSPFRHVTPTDAVASGYRVVALVLLGVGVLVIVWVYAS
jgi:hypothetical protein